MNWISLLGLDALVARWRATGAEGVLAAQDRLELAQLEWQQQKRHWRQLLALALTVAALTVLFLGVLSLALIVQFWDTPQRSLVAWLLSGAWLLLWLAAVTALVSVAKRGGGAFGLTRRELRQDWHDFKEGL